MNTARSGPRRVPSTAGYVLATTVMILLAWLVYDGQAARGAPTAGPDLTVEIVLDPAAPDVNEEFTIRVIVRNIGTSAAGKFTAYLYTDPADRPPTTSTIGFPLISWPGLAAGGSAGDNVEGSTTHTFTTEGCDHVIYAWVDRDKEVAEDKEDNNLATQQVCVGVQCEPDAFEDDNALEKAKWLTENAAQAHTLCHPTDETQADTDQVKFTVFSGITYTLATTNRGTHADLTLALGDGCGVQPPGSGDSVTWHSPVSAICHAAITQDGAPIGQLTAYSLTLSSATGVTDPYEPDNQCAAARDITTDGERQTHLFQAPGDQDWVQFTIKAGDSFIAIADNPGPSVSPVVTIFNACNQVDGGNSLAGGAQQIEYSSTTDNTYFARVANQNSNNFGANAHYDLRIIASTCQADDQEPDNAPAQARNVAVGAAAKTHSFCPAGDEDWVKFTAQAGKIYVLQTSNLAFAADTVIQLYNTDGVTQLAQNDDYGYTSASRITWEASTNGVYFARIRHVNIVASGPNTQYDFSIHEGFCNPDAGEGDRGDNGPGDAAALTTDGKPQAHNFCADPLRVDLGDQDWVRFNAVAQGKYRIQTSNLGRNSDTVLELYGLDGKTLLKSNDDIGEGRLASLDFTPIASGDYFVRITQYNSNVLGAETDYALNIVGSPPPPPTPTPTPTAPPPTPTPTPELSTLKTLILVNRARLTTVFGAAKTNQLMPQLFALADAPEVNGLVVQVETDQAIAAAYAAWTANATTLADNAKANDVIAAIRNRVLTFADSAPQLAYVVIVGDDRIIPFRRVLDKVAPQGPSADSIEEKYAPDVTGNGTVRAALTANMILTDDYLVDKVPSHWEDRQHNQYDLYLPDYAVSRLVEDPNTIRAFINNFLAGDKTITTSKVLVTGYDFLQDSANSIKTLYSADAINADGQLIAPLWELDDLREKYLKATPRFDIYSINGHSTHVAQGTPDQDVAADSSLGLKAAEVTEAATDLTGALVYSAGCHGGLNDPGVLDLPEAYLQKLANYVGNTGFGWGASGVVYTEALMRNYSRELLRDAKAEIGPALAAAKKRYYTQALTFNAFDAKILMQVTLYGLPMVAVTSGGALTDDEPFPSAEREFTPPSSLSALPQGTIGYQLPGSFGAFGDSSSDQGRTFDLNDHTAVASGEPVQPLYFGNAAAPAVGELRGAVFLGGVYSDVVGFDPVIALAVNEYVTDESEPVFTSDAFFPALPFAIRGGADVPGIPDTLVMSLGQFRSDSDVHGVAAAETGVNRIFDQMSFGTYYSNSPDRNAANISFVDGVLTAPGAGQIKVETQDSSGIHRVVVAYHERQGQWQSKDLAYDNSAKKWTTVITGTVTTEFFVQVVDNAGNVAVNNNKGRNYRLMAPLPLAVGRPVVSRVLLPFLDD